MESVFRINSSEREKRAGDAFRAYSSPVKFCRSAWCGQKTGGGIRGRCPLRRSSQPLPSRSQFIGLLHSPGTRSWWHRRNNPADKPGGGFELLLTLRVCRLVGQTDIRAHSSQLLVGGPVPVPERACSGLGRAPTDLFTSTPNMVSRPALMETPTILLARCT